MNVHDNAADTSINVSVSKELKNKIKAIAKKRKRSLAWIVREGIEKLLNEAGDNNEGTRPSNERVELAEAAGGRGDDQAEDGRGEGLTKVELRGKR